MFRSDRKNLQKLPKDLKLQIIDCYEHDVFKQYQICIFCINEQSLSVCLKINNYQPFFYVKLPKKTSVDDFGRLLQEQDEINAEMTIEYKKLFEGYKEEFEPFLRLSFTSLYSYNQAKWYITKQTDYIICDIGLCPIIKFFHEKSIKTAGWIHVQNYQKVKKKFLNMPIRNHGQ